MTIKEKAILEDKLNRLEKDIETILKKLHTENDYSHESLDEFLQLSDRRQELINLVFDYGYWFKRLHEDGWEIDSESFR